MVVLAGGLGTRLSDVTGGLFPKAMCPVLGEPFIDVKLRDLRMMGVTEVILLVGELGEQIEAHVGAGSQFGLRVTYVYDGERLLGTGGTVRHVLDQLPDTFWVTYGDTIVVADLANAEVELRTRGLDGLMCVLRNEDEWGVSNVSVVDGLVTRYEKDGQPGTFHWIDYGLLLFSKRAFGGFLEEDVFGLESVIQEMIVRSSLLAWPVQDRFWEIGTPSALAETEEHLMLLRTLET